MEIAVFSLSGGGNCLSDILPRHDFPAPLLGPEEEGFLFFVVVEVRNINGSADGVSPIVLLVSRAGNAGAVILPRVGVEEIVAAVMEGAAMELLRAGFGFNFDGAGTVLAILRAVVGGEDFEFGDGFEIRVY